MRTMIVGFAALAVLAACGQREAAKAPAETPPPAAIPQAAFTPMSAERTALCSAALEAWKGLGTTNPPGGMSVADFGERAPLLGLRGMELERADAAGFKAQRATADAAWKDKTPADIEAATVACLSEIKA